MVDQKIKKVKRYNDLFKERVLGKVIKIQRWYRKIKGIEYQNIMVFKEIQEDKSKLNRLLVDMQKAVQQVFDNTLDRKDENIQQKYEEDQAREAKAKIEEQNKITQMTKIVKGIGKFQDILQQIKEKRQKRRALKSFQENIQDIKKKLKEEQMLFQSKQKEQLNLKVNQQERQIQQKQKTESEQDEDEINDKIELSAEMKNLLQYRDISKKLETSNIKLNEVKKVLTNIKTQQNSKRQALVSINHTNIKKSQVRPAMIFQTQIIQQSKFKSIERSKIDDNQPIRNQHFHKKHHSVNVKKSPKKKLIKKSKFRTTIDLEYSQPETKIVEMNKEYEKPVPLKSSQWKQELNDFLNSNTYQVNYGLKGKRKIKTMQQDDNQF